MSDTNPDLGTFGLLGLGTMGAGIAHVLAASGRTVIAVEADEQRLAAGIRTISGFLDGGITRGRLDEAAKQEILGRIRGTTRLEDLADADAVLEAVTENPHVKKDLLGRVAAVVGAEVPILTNTSALSVTDLAAALPHPERVAGLHFFNPAPLMRTVEVVAALQTDASLFARLIALVESLEGKTAIPVKDRPGFLINALLLPYLNDVVNEFDAGLATAEDIDVALKLGLGYKSGPMELLDLVGLDVQLFATQAAYDATLDPRYAPPPLLRQMVAAGRLGAKNGKGFRIDTASAD